MVLKRTDWYEILLALIRADSAAAGSRYGKF
jgi:hypothetical protein